MSAVGGRPRISARQAGKLETFTREILDVQLRPYQIEAAQAVIRSIGENAGRTIVILFSRQSGKDELCADLKTYLLVRNRNREMSIVEVNPTYKPQTINAIDRFEARLLGSSKLRREWRKRSDFIRFLGRARVTFLSGDSKANVVGATASLLLIVNEAQDVEPAVYDRNFAPMAASTNATRLFMGTAWTSQTLLARELRAARQAEQADGIRRVFTFDAADVRRLVPAYGAHVDEEIRRLGRGHPLIKTQYFNEEIDAEAGMFTPARRALMRCDSSSVIASEAKQSRTSSDTQPGIASPHTTGLAMTHTTVFTLDVAGQDETAFHDPEAQLLRNPGRDSVTLTIAGVDLSAMDVLQAPIFRILQRHQWTGLNHLHVFAKVAALADQWRPQHIIIDATGVGEGLWAMLDKRFPTRVIPVKFSAQKKSELGYRFLAMIETGRLRDCSVELSSNPRRQPQSAHRLDRQLTENERGGVLPTHSFSASFSPLPEGEGPGVRGDQRNPSADDPQIFSSAVSPAMVDRQYSACISEVLLGPQRTMRWGVPDGTRDENGDLIHDDILMADALLAEADQLEWRLSSPALIIPPKDPLDEMSHFRSQDL